MSQPFGLEISLPDESVFFSDPYPFYARLREMDRPFWLPHTQDTSSQGICLFGRYPEALEIFRQNSSVSKNLRSIRPDGYRSAFDTNVLLRDGDDHLRLRRLVGEYFSLRSVGELRPVMAAVVDSFIERLAGREEWDFIGEFAEPLPLAIIAMLIGVPDDDMARVRQWSLVLSDGFDSLLCNDGVRQVQQRAMQEFLDYVGQLIEFKRSTPDDSMLSSLIAVEGKNLDAEELVGMLGLLLFAGHETIVSLIGNTLWLLLSHPEQKEKLMRHPELVANVIEESLRYESPEQRTSFRLLREPLVIGGHKLEVGQQIGAIIGSANRDESVFELANQFDISRTPNKHLAFGIGIHNCLGKTLARAEAQVALGQILGHLDRWQLVDERPLWRRNSFFRGLAALRIRCL